MTTERTEADSIIELARESAHEVVKIENGAELLVGPGGLDVKDMEPYLAAPRQLHAKVLIADPVSFLEYISRFGTSRTVVYATRAQLQLTAIIDHHGREKPSWRSHKAQLQLELSTAWLAWLDANGSAMDQERFSEFLEDRAEDIRAPEAAAIIEMIQLMRATKSVNFRRAVNLANGQVQLVWEENVQAKVGAGEETVPDHLELSIPVFKDSDIQVRLQGRIRFRLREGQLRWFYSLVRHEVALEQAWKDACAMILDGLSEMGIPVLNGAGVAG